MPCDSWATLSLRKSLPTIRARSPFTCSPRSFRVCTVTQPTLDEWPPLTRFTFRFGVYVSGDNIATRREQPPIDIAALHAPGRLAEPTFDDDGTGEMMVWLIRSKVKGNGLNRDFEREVVPTELYGQFFAGERCVSSRMPTINHRNETLRS